MTYINGDLYTPRAGTEGVARGCKKKGQENLPHKAHS